MKYLVRKYASTSMSEENPSNWIREEEYGSIKQMLLEGEILLERQLEDKDVLDISREVPLYYRCFEIEEEGIEMCGTNYIEKGFIKAYKEAIRDERQGLIEEIGNALDLNERQEIEFRLERLYDLLKRI